MTIREAVADDATALAVLAAQTFVHTWRAVIDQPKALADYLEESFSAARLRSDLSRGEALYLVAEDEHGRLIGYARLVDGALPPAPLYTPDVRPMLLDRFYLDSAWHGTGLADRLLAVVIERTARFGATVLWLSHYPANTRAGRFYARHGFVDTNVVLLFVLGERCYEDTVLCRPI